MLGNSAYSTEQTQYTTVPDAAASEPSAPARTRVPGHVGLMETLQIDVRLTVPNDLVVEGERPAGRSDGPISLGALNVTLGGDLYRHQVPDDQLRLYGAVNTVRGTYDFQGRRFEILRDGTVRFDGLDDFDPELDIRTQRIIQGGRRRTSTCAAR